MTKKKIISFLMVAAVAGILVYIFLFGKLFPYSPVVVGFDRHELQHAVVYVEKGARFDRFQEIDSHIRKVEDFHTLSSGKSRESFSSATGNLRRPLRRRPVLCFLQRRYRRFPPGLRRSVEGLISMEIYSGTSCPTPCFFSSRPLERLPVSKWLLEGIAVYSAGQMGTSWYPSKEQVYGYLRDGDFMPPAIYGQRRKTRSGSRKTKKRIQLFRVRMHRRISYRQIRQGSISRIYERAVKRKQT